MSSETPTEATDTLEESAAECRYTERATLGGDYSVLRPLRRLAPIESYRVVDRTGIHHDLKLISNPPIGAEKVLVSWSGTLSRHLVPVSAWFRSDHEGLGIVTPVSPSTLHSYLAAGGPPFEPHRALDYAIGLAHALIQLERDERLPWFVSSEAIALWPDGVALDLYYLAAVYADTDELSMRLGSLLAPGTCPNNPRPPDAVYGLGRVLAEMISGRFLLDGPSQTVIAKSHNGRVDLPHLPDVWQALLRSCLDPCPGRRPSSLVTLLDELKRLKSNDNGGLVALSTPPACNVSDEDSSPDSPRLVHIGTNARGYEVFERAIDRSRMVLLPGDPDAQIGPFLIDETPVTWEAMLSVHGDHGDSCQLCKNRALVFPSRFGGRAGRRSRWFRHRKIEESITEKSPASCLTWYEATEFARAVGGDLATETEWEYACRAGSDVDMACASDDPATHAWFENNSGGLLPKVGLKQPNAFGLYDMAGCVQELCSPGEICRPTSVPCRGGSYVSTFRAIGASARNVVPRDHAAPYTGFRCVIRRKDSKDWQHGAFNHLNNGRGSSESLWEA